MNKQPSAKRSCEDKKPEQQQQQQQQKNNLPVIKDYFIEKETSSSSMAAGTGVAQPTSQTQVAVSLNDNFFMKAGNMWQHQGLPHHLQETQQQMLLQQQQHQQHQRQQQLWVPGNKNAAVSMANVSTMEGLEEPGRENRKTSSFNANVGMLQDTNSAATSEQTALMLQNQYQEQMWNRNGTATRPTANVMPTGMTTSIASSLWGNQSLQRQQQHYQTQLLAAENSLNPFSGVGPQQKTNKRSAEDSSLALEDMLSPTAIFGGQKRSRRMDEHVTNENKVRKQRRRASPPSDSAVALQHNDDKQLWGASMEDLLDSSSSITVPREVFVPSPPTTLEQEQHSTYPAESFRNPQAISSFINPLNSNGESGAMVAHPLVKEGAPFCNVSSHANEPGSSSQPAVSGRDCDGLVQIMRSAVSSNPRPVDQEGGQHSDDASRKSHGVFSAASIGTIDVQGIDGGNDGMGYMDDTGSVASFESDYIQEQNLTVESMERRYVVDTANDTKPIAPIAEGTGQERAPMPGNSESSSALGAEATRTISRVVDEADWGDWDVPLGRRKGVRQHVGNIRFRRIIEERRPEYQKLVRKGEKTKVARSIFQLIKSNGGRFIDKRKVSGVSEWIEIPDDRAQAKISQALRNRGVGDKNKSEFDDEDSEQQDNSTY